MEDLQANLKDLYKEFTDGKIPNIRKTAELEGN
jgi:hypothetical protein